MARSAITPTIVWATIIGAALAALSKNLTATLIKTPLLLVILLVVGLFVFTGSTGNTRLFIAVTTISAVISFFLLQIIIILGLSGLLPGLEISTSLIRTLVSIKFVIPILAISALIIFFVLPPIRRLLKV